MSPEYPTDFRQTTAAGAGFIGHGQIAEVVTDQRCRKVVQVGDDDAARFADRARFVVIAQQLDHDTFRHDVITAALRTLASDDADLLRAVEVGNFDSRASAGNARAANRAGFRLWCAPASDGQARHAGRIGFGQIEQGRKVVRIGQQIRRA